ncbi:MAG: signal peptide peptidase SppA [Proteobacteria bacterium]|nr:signal peptide peptidase SppA [Pseudomonadota bacterium]
MMERVRLFRWVALAACLCVLGTGCTLLELNMGPRLAPLEERIIAGSGPDKVLLIDISGILLESRTRSLGTPFSPRENLLARLTEELDRARKDVRVKALLLKINSPGGSVTAADLMAHQIESYCAQTGAKSVAVLMSTAASGGYYVALAADRIVAVPTSVTGSIGVISLRLDVAELLARYGVKTDAVKSAPLKDMWSPFRPVTEEERRIMQALIDDLFERFKNRVREKRPGMTGEQLDRAATARIFTASQALELGLIDQVGYPDEAFEIAFKMAGLPRASLVAYHRPGGYRPNVYAESPAVSESDAPDWLGLAATPQMMYLWLPGWR